MVYLWDYDEKELQKTEKGRIFILERMINYGPGKKKIKLSDVKKYWDKIKFKRPGVKQLLELLIYGKIITREHWISEQEKLGMDNDEWFVYCIKRGFKPIKYVN